MARPHARPAPGPVCRRPAHLHLPRARHRRRLLPQAPAPQPGLHLAQDTLAADAPSGPEPACGTVLQAITNPAKGARLRGLILDLRGNGGGDPEVSRLLGAFTHGAAYVYLCDVHGSCAATYTDTDAPLLHLPLVVLTDRNCVSACDAFSGAVKDLRLGTLVGTRTGGILSGPAAAYLLDDASLIILPPMYASGADTEIIDGIGVAPDYYLPLTAQDLSTGHDPGIAKALTLLGG